MSDRAMDYYQSLEDKSGTLAGLVELAAAGNGLADRIAKALEQMEAPDRGQSGRKETVSDDRILELRVKGFTQKAIAIEVGLSRTQVGNRLRKLAKAQNQTVRSQRS